MQINTPEYLHIPTEIDMHPRGIVESVEAKGRPRIHFYALLVAVNATYRYS